MAIDLGNGVVIDRLGGHEVEAATRRRSRRGPSAFQLDDITSALDAGLLEANFEVAADALIEPESDRRGRRVRQAEVVSPVIDVTVDEEESAVLLIESLDGVLHWQFPDEEEGGRRTRSRSGPATISFTLRPYEEAPAERGRRGQRGPIGWIADRLLEPIRVRVLRFFAGMTIDKAIEMIEGDLVPGLVSMHGSTDTWTAQGVKPAMPADRPSKILLFVHGTFSSTQGSYSALEALDKGWAFMEAARERYDAVLGCDHLTLAEDPDANAELLLKELDFLPQGSIIDAVVFSRGGLVYRAFANRVAKTRRPDLVFRKAVFVGCTNSGTYLAEPDNWYALVELYTNILVAGSRAISFLGSPVVGTILARAIATLGRFVQLLPRIGVEEGRVPGLAAMEPDGDYVTKIGALASRIEDKFAITSDFEPRIDPSRGISGGLAQFLADRVVDRLMGRSNDLVVHTGSMARFGEGQVLPEERVLRFAPADALYHTIYFTDPRAIGLLARVLLADDGEEEARQPRMVPTGRVPRAIVQPAPGWSGPGDVVHRPRRMSRSARSGRETVIEKSFGAPSIPKDGMDSPVPAFPDSRTMEEMAAPDVSMPDEATAPETPETTEAPSAEPEAEAVSRPASLHVAAEMNPRPLLGSIAPLFVTLSRQEIAVALHAAARRTDAPVEIDEDAAIKVKVLALENCWVSSDDPEARTDDNETSVSLQVPVPARSEVLRFMVEGAERGVARVLVEVSQKSQVLVSFNLEPNFVDGDSDRLSAEAIVQPATDVESAAATLRIYEQSLPEGGVLLKYDLYCPDPSIAITEECRLPRSFSAEAFAEEYLKALEDANGLGDAEYDHLYNEFADFSVVKSAELIPPPVHEELWKYRAQISSIQVFSENAHIPWELLAIAFPDENGDEQIRFLAEWGLVRWMFNARVPRREIRIRSDAVRYVIPDYLDDRDDLAGAQAERDMLKTFFPGATEIEASTATVRDFLRGEAASCDLLHFACHGLAEQRSVLTADLLMTGFKEEDGRIVSERLTCDTVKHHSRFAEGDPNTMVIVNACQTGRPGLGIAGVSGFADAFLRPRSRQGAACFIGALWSVDDQSALTFASAVYDGMCKQGLTLVEATKAARVACRDKFDFTWLAYTVYGNPNARFVLSGETP